MYEYLRNSQNILSGGPAPMPTYGNLENWSTSFVQPTYFMKKSLLNRDPYQSMTQMDLGL
jgi:hypothetical protein